MQDVVSFASLYILTTYSFSNTSNFAAPRYASFFVEIIFWVRFVFLRPHGRSNRFWVSWTQKIMFCMGVKFVFYVSPNRLDIETQISRPYKK